MKKRKVEKILVPVDGSKESVSACIWATSVAEDLGAEVILIHIVDMNEKMSLMDRVTMSGYIPDRLKKEGKKLLAEYVSHMPKGIKVQSLLKAGDPGKVIVSEAEDLQPDWIVMGSAGQGEFVSLVMGSVSQYVLHHTNLPVLIVKDEDSAEDGFDIKDNL